MITMMIVMDCLHFANYFVPLIYNSELLQSAVKARQKLIAFAKSIAALFTLQRHKRLDSLHQVGHITLNTNKMM